MDLTKLIFRRKRLKDTSKRNLIVRADKRERFLAYAYIRGKFIYPKNHDPKDIRLILTDINHDNPLDKIMLDLLGEVDWFERIKKKQTIKKYKSRIKNDGNIVIFKNAENKVYMRLLNKRVYLKRSKGILYLYTPLTFFAWLSAPRTIYYSNKEKHKDKYVASIFIKHKEDAEYILNWLKYGALEEVTGTDLNNHYDIDAHVSENRIYFTQENLDKMINYISKDKYVGSYVDVLIHHIQKEGGSVFNAKKEEN